MTTLSAATVFDQMVDIERHLDVTRFRVDGIDLWWQIRDHLVIAGYRELDGSSTRHGHLARVVAKLPLLPPAVSGVIRRWWHTRPSSFGQPGDGDRVDVLVLGDESNRRLRRQGRWYDVFLDPVVDEIEQMGASCRVMLLNRAGVAREPGYRPAVAISGFMVRRYVESVAGAWRVHLQPDFAAAYRDLVREAERVGAQNRIPTLGALRLEAAYTMSLLRWCGEQLDLLRPGVVFMAPYSSYAGRAMCVAARARGIPVVDVQHGVQGRLHPAYARFPVLPGGLTVMPTHYLTWTADDRAVIAEWAEPSGLTALEVGNPLLNQFLSGGPLAADADVDVQAQLGASTGETRVLVTLSWWRDIPEEFLTIMATSPSNYRFLVRLHPGGTSTQRSRIVARLSAEPLRSRCEWDAASELPLYGVLRRVDAHLTQESTVVLEAEEFGVHSVITSERGRAYFAGPLARGTAIWANGVEQIRAALNRCVRARGTPAPAAQGRQARFRAALAGILRKEAAS